MKITIPEFSLVLLIGPAGAGKSTLAHKHFKSTEILSSDFFRGMVSDDENNQAVSKDAFEVLHFVAAKRLAAGKLTVIDATNVQPEARNSLITLARKYHYLPVAIVLNLPEALCRQRDQERPKRSVGPSIVHLHSQQLQNSLPSLEQEGFRRRDVYILNSVEEINTAEILRQPLDNNRKYEHGPFDIIGDIHGCFEEVHKLLTKLGYEIIPEPEGHYAVHHPEGRKVIFLGDLVDRGPKIPAVLKLVMNMVESGVALCVPGNHDTKLLRKLRGENVRITHGLAESLAQLTEESPAFKEQVMTFINKLVSHYVLDDGKLVVAHAGMKESLQGRDSGTVRSFAQYGETTGETDEFGLPVRYNWAAEYQGKAMVVYGHTPIAKLKWLNRTINIDTGCVFGGSLTALRYPEKELVSVKAAHTYYASSKPFLAEGEQAPALRAQQTIDLT
ncbi:MAG: AAA family ATPase [Gloeobacterales cyanobacterium]